LTVPSDENGQKVQASIIVSPFKGKSPEAYIKNLLYSYTMNFKKFLLESKEEIIINSVSFASFIIQHTMKGIDYTTQTVFTIQESIVYQINAVAENEHFTRNSALIEKIIKTFRIAEKS